jgi:hypothetical protein
MSAQHGASSGCGYRKQTPAMVGAVYTMNKQPQIDDKGWSFIFRVGWGLIIPQKNKIVTNHFMSLGLGWILRINNLCTVTWA